MKNRPKIRPPARALLMLVVGVVAAVAALIATRVWLTRTVVLPWLADAAGMRLEARELGFPLSPPRLEVEGLVLVDLLDGSRIEAARATLPLASLEVEARDARLTLTADGAEVARAERVRMSLAPDALGGATTELRGLVLERARIPLELDAPGGPAVVRLFARPSSRPEPDAPPAPVVIEELRIEGGTVELRDGSAGGDGFAIDLVDVEASLEGLRVGGERSQRPLADLRLRARIAARAEGAAAGRVTVVGWMPPLVGATRATWMGAAVGLERDLLEPYLSTPGSLLLQGERVDLVAALQVEEDRLDGSTVVLVADGGEQRFAATLAGPLAQPRLDAESPLATVVELPWMPVAALGEVGWRATRGLGLASLDAAERLAVALSDGATDLGSGDLLDASGGILEALAEGLKGIGGSLGEAVTGDDDSTEARAARIDAELRQLERRFLDQRATAGPPRPPATAE